MTQAKRKSARVEKQQARIMENDPITALVMKSLRNCMHQEGRNGGEKPWLWNQTLVMRMTEKLIEVH